MDTTKTMAVIHPQGDESTRFLTPIYGGDGSPVDVYGADLLDALSQYRILAMGHGSPNGLYDASYQTVLHADHADALREGLDNIYVWCFASEFLKRHDLKGFTTGMFISEPLEAKVMGVTASDAEINMSNALFTSILRKYLNRPAEQIYAAMMAFYKGNAVIDYNRNRMVLS